MNGRGQYEWSDGTVYNGEMMNDKITGKGIKKWAKGNYYEGNWLDGKRKQHL